MCIRADREDFMDYNILRELVVDPEKEFRITHG
jgi:hypothetical protein